VSHYRFEWDPAKAHANEVKHGVTFDEAQTVFADLFAVETADRAHSISEDRLIIIGISQRGRVLVISFTLRDNDLLRLISARPASRREIYNYEENSRHR
jgi:uncharacterized DUF497 family protein